MLKVELFVISFWIFQEISPFWSWRGISSMSWAHKTHSLRGIYTQPSCSAQAAEKKIGLVLLHSFKIVFISLVLSIWCRFSWPAHNGSSRVMLVWVWKKSFCPDPLPSLLLWMPTDNGVNFSYLLSLTSALWCSNVPEPSKERISRNDGVGQNYCFDIALFGCFLDGMLLQFFVNWIGCILISKKVLKKIYISYHIWYWKEGSSLASLFGFRWQPRICLWQRSFLSSNKNIRCI